MAVDPVTLPEFSEPEDVAVGGVEAPTQKRMPFAYAKRHGVLIGHVEDGHATVLCREGVSALTLAEMRRYLDMPFTIERLDNEGFDAVLRQSYEHGSGEAMHMMEDLGEDLDLSRVAMQLPEPEDLLESEDDAPIIRLINALFTEAIKENASDIHIEPYERRLIVRFRVDGVLREDPRAAPGHGAPGGLAHQDHGQAGHRREAPAPGRAHLPAHRRAGGGRARVHHPQRSR